MASLSLPKDKAGQQKLLLGIMPFLIAEILRLTLLTIFPEITLWLPRVMG